MNTCDGKAARLGHITSRALWVFELVPGAHVVVSYVPRHFNFSETTYGPYYWPRANYLLPHILGGRTMALTTHDNLGCTSGLAFLAVA